METTWILVADEAKARILEQRAVGQDFQEIEELTDAAAHAHAADLKRDADGRYYGKGERLMAHTSEPRTEPLEKEADLFARRVAEKLGEARRKHRFEHLRIAAAPKFLGRLRQQLDKEVQDVVLDEVDKDLVNLDVRALTQQLGVQAPPLR